MKYCQALTNTDLHAFIFTPTDNLVGSNSADLHVFGLCGKLKEAGTWTWDILAVRWQCYTLRHCAPCKVVDIVTLLSIPVINGTAGLGLKLFFSIVQFDVPPLEHKVFLFIPALCLARGFQPCSWRTSFLPAGFISNPASSHLPVIFK